MKVVMKTVEAIKASELLKAHLMAKDDLWEYEPGWSDTKIAEAVGRIDAGHILRLRLELGMRLIGSNMQSKAPSHLLRLLVSRFNTLADNCGYTQLQITEAEMTGVEE